MSGSQYRFIPNPGLFPKLMLPTTHILPGKEGGGQGRGLNGQRLLGTHAWEALQSQWLFLLEAHIFAGQEVTRKEDGPGVRHHPQMSRGFPSRKEAQSAQIHFQGPSKGTHLQRPYSTSAFWLTFQSGWLFLSRSRELGRFFPESSICQ